MEAFATRRSRLALSDAIVVTRDLERPYQWVVRAESAIGPAAKARLI